MTWSITAFFKPRERASLDEEVRKQRGELAKALVQGDRVRSELRSSVMSTYAGAMRMMDRENEDR